MYGILTQWKPCWLPTGIKTSRWVYPNYSLDRGATTRNRSVSTSSKALLKDPGLDPRRIKGVQATPSLHGRALQMTARGVCPIRSQGDANIDPIEEEGRGNKRKGPGTEKSSGPHFSKLQVRKPLQTWSSCLSRKRSQHQSSIFAGHHCDAICSQWWWWRGGEW